MRALRVPIPKAAGLGTVGEGVINRVNESVGNEREHCDSETASLPTVYV